MRQNLFLHFLNRDTREIFKLDELVERDHSRLLTQALNAAVILCEDAVYSPPGFILEDNLLFRLAEQAKPFLTSGVWKLPIREHSLTDYAEKKRTDYGKIRDRYSGLFDDTRLSYLSSHASGLVSREAEITSGIIKGFQKGPDGDSLAWKKVKKSFSSNEVVSASKLPLLAVEQGQAATWSVLEQLIEADPQIALSVLRPTLQHTYFDLYCQEYGLIILSGQAMTPMEIDILSAQLEVFVEGCSELYDTKRRTDETNKGFIKNMSIPTLDTRSSLVLFVALREELDVLKSILDLKVLANGNVAARGVLHGRTIEVICPRDMGRVPASSYMTRYLASQSSPRETNILVLGRSYRK